MSAFFADEGMLLVQILGALFCRNQCGPFRDCSHYSGVPNQGDVCRRSLARDCLNLWSASYAFFSCEQESSIVSFGKSEGPLGHHVF